MCFVLFLESKYDNVQALCLKEKDAKTCKVVGSDKKRSLEIKETEKNRRGNEKSDLKTTFHSQAIGLVLWSSARYDRVGVGAEDLKQG